MNARLFRGRVPPLLVVSGAGVFGWLLQYGGAWLVHHDSVYYRLSGAGFRFLTNLAEELSFIGPVLPTALGLLLGSGLVLVMRYRRLSRHA